MLVNAFKNSLMINHIRLSKTFNLFLRHTNADLKTLLSVPLITLIVELNRRKDLL